MRTSDILVLSFRQLKERKLRSILTLLAIAVGVISIIALSAQVEGVSALIVRSLESLGPETLMVTPRGTTQFTDADVLRLTTLEGVSSVIPIRNTRVAVSGMETSVSLYGISSSDFASLAGEVKLLAGNMYYDVTAPQVLVGHDLGVDELDKLVYQPGQPIRVQIGKSSTMMTVVGVLDAYGGMSMVQPDTSLFTPVEYMNALTGSGGYTQLIVKAESSEDADQVAELLGYVFGGRASVLNLKQLAETVTSIIQQMSLLLVAIAGTSFIAAGLGTFNIMMISVLERVREIGILKAVGMKDRGVLMLYITQGLLLGLFGSLIGFTLGSITAYSLPIILEHTMGFGEQMGSGGGFNGMPMGGQGMAGGFSSFTPVISPTFVGMAVALSMVVTLLSSAYPAWKASRMSPVEALRYE